jgi:predicted flap endonuclease-1-like 5' DNA nuclease
MSIWTALILGLLIGWIVEWAIDWIYWRQRTQNSTAELANLRVQHSRLRADLTAGAGSLGKIKSELAALQVENERLRGDLNAATGSLGQYKAELGALNTSLSAARADSDQLRDEIGALRAEQASAQTTAGTHGTANQFKTQLLAIDPTLAESAEGVHLSSTDDQIFDAEPERMQAVGQQQRDPLIDINGIGPVYEQRLFDAGIYTFADLVAQSPERLRELVGAKSWQETATEAWIAEARQFIQAGRGRSAQ